MVYQVITSSQAVTLISVTPKHAINEWSLVDVNRVMIFITSSDEYKVHLAGGCASATPGQSGLRTANVVLVVFPV